MPAEMHSLISGISRKAGSSRRLSVRQTLSEEVYKNVTPTPNNRAGRQYSFGPSSSKQAFHQWILLHAAQGLGEEGNQGGEDEEQEGGGSYLERH